MKFQLCCRKVNTIRNVIPFICIGVFSINNRDTMNYKTEFAPPGKY